MIKESEDTPDPDIDPEDDRKGTNSMEDNYAKGIEKLRIESNKINNNIKEMENMLEMVKVQKELKNEKDKALSDYRKLNKSNIEGFANIVMISIILLGLLVGANLAKGYNSMFKGKPVLNKEVIINKSENYINQKINEDIDINDKEIKINKDIKNVTKIENNIDKKNESEFIKNNINDKNVPPGDDKEKENITDKKVINEKNEENKNDNNNKEVKIEKNEEKKKEKIEKIIIEKEVKKNEIENKNDEKQSGDFLSFSFLAGVYICLLQLII